VNAPVAVDNLGDAKIDPDRDQRDRLVLGQSLVFIRKLRIFRNASRSASSIEDFL
jgi:hypothetical protein